MTGKASISVVVPAYNEAGNIGPTVTKLYRFLQPRFHPFEILVVDDGSVDGTSDAVKATVEKERLQPAAVKTIRHHKNLGYGAALCSGFYAAVCELVLLYPGDGQFDVEEVGTLVAAMAEIPAAELAIIWPYRTRRVEGLRRKINERLYHWLIAIVFGVQLRDIDCGFKLYRRTLFAHLPPLTSRGALIDAEILVHCRRLGVTIREVPVIHLLRRQGDQTGATLRVILYMFVELFRFKLRLKKQKYQEVTKK